MRETESERRSLGDRKIDVVSLFLHGVSTSRCHYSRCRYFCGLPLPNIRVVTRSQICNPACDATKTRKEARMAAVLASSLTLAMESTCAGGGARFRTTGGDLVIR